MNEQKKTALNSSVAADERQSLDNTNNIITQNDNNINTTAIKFFSEIQAQTIDWLWYPYIPFGKVTIIQGDPGEGKTTLALNIAAILSRGEYLPTELEYTYNYNSITTIYQTAEDGLEDTIKPRLLAANADCTKVCTIIEGKEALHFQDERIEKVLVSTGAKLLIMDPIQAYLGSNIDMHRANEIRPVMQFLTTIADKYKCAIVLIGHMNKSGKKAKYKGLGSIDINAAARSVLYVGRIDNDNFKRCIIPIKSNLAPEGRAVLFSVGDQLSWDGFDDIEISTICNDTEISGNDNPKTKILQAEDLFKEIIQTQRMIKSTEIEELANIRRISKRTLETAKRNLGIKSKKINDNWYYIFD
ncbi:MAG: AAA family ATPase [Oscillospiraceae bacterium]|nr:AAA family ATPase [Oscillospiraceae bacterium]